MSDGNKSSVKLLKSRLNKFVQLICEKAEGDEEFRQKLESIFLDNTSSRNELSSKRKLPGENFNLVAYLQERGDESLRLKLEEKTDTELHSILRTEGIRKGRDLKNLDRSQIISEIVEITKSRLKQGSAFL